MSLTHSTVIKIRRGGVCIYVLLTTALLACYQDYRYHKIYNAFIIIAGLTGVIYQGMHQGFSGTEAWIINAVLVFFFTYPLFRLGMLGAGDVKLFMITAGMFPSKTCLWFLFASFFAGAIISLLKMILKKNLFKRITYFITYAKIVCNDGELFLYDEGTSKEHTIHFAGPILIGVLLHMGGIY